MIKQIPGPSMAVRAADDLRRAIRGDVFGPEGRLPAEPVLSERLGVSRGTVREAISVLEQEGLLFRRQGVGTFVLRAISGLTNNLNANFGVTELIVAANKVPGTTGLSIGETEADAAAAKPLAVPRGSPLLRIARTRTADGVPVAHTTDLISLDLLKRHDLNQATLNQTLRAGQSLYTVLRAAGIQVRHGVAELTPVSADEALASNLGMATGTLLFRLDQIDYDRDGEPILLSVEHLAASAFRAQVYRRGPG